MKLVFVGLCILAAFSRTEAAQCQCAINDVHVRSGVGTSHAILGWLTRGNCVPYKGDKSSGWVHVDYNGKDGWIAGNYVNIQTCGSSSGTTSGHGCPHIVSRAQWGAVAPKSISHLSGPVKYVFIHHGASHSCTTESACAAEVKGYQNFHMNKRGWSDIGYSFVIGEDGNAYEGRGWDRIGAHTQGYNSVGLGFSMIGNFMTHLPNTKALGAVKALIACGVSLGKIQTNYILRGHRDMGQTACPGDQLYALIKTWPHY